MDRRLTFLLAAAASVASACARAPTEQPPATPRGYERAVSDVSGPEARDGQIVTPLSPAAGRDLTRLEAALQRFAQDRAGRLPTELRELAAEKSLDGKPYVRSVPVDPWGQPYAYAVLSVRLGSYDLRSYGPDRLAGTADDVVARTDRVETH